MSYLYSVVLAGLALQLSLGAADTKNVPYLKGKNLNANVSHTSRQTRPIPLGVSGGSTVDLANGYCCSGTLGSLVKDSAGTFYILSNTHVFAGDSAIGGNGKKSAKGDPINQPGYVDVSCQKRTADYVATLERWIALVPSGTSSVDAAIAKIVAGQVNTEGSILEIGTISKTPRSAFIGQQVKKSGRTSGLTTGKVSAINATVSVQYENECAGSAYVTTFKNQILVTPGTFIKPGDSGSLLVENIAANPRPVGLLFAGGSTVAVANPIQNVLTALNVSFVGLPTSLSELSKFEQLSAESLTHTIAIQERHGEALMQIKGILGHAVGVSKNNDQLPVVLVLVRKADDAITSKVPQMLDGIPVEFMEVGKIRAY